MIDVCVVKLLGQCCMLYTQTVRKNAGKAKAFKAVSEEGREAYSVYTDQEREVRQGR